MACVRGVEIGAFGCDAKGLEVSPGVVGSVLAVGDCGGVLPCG